MQTPDDKALEEFLGPDRYDEYLDAEERFFSQPPLRRELDKEVIRLIVGGRKIKLAIRKALKKHPHLAPALEGETEAETRAYYEDYMDHLFERARSIQYQKNIEEIEKLEAKIAANEAEIDLIMAENADPKTTSD